MSSLLTFMLIYKKLKFEIILNNDNIDIAFYKKNLNITFNYF